MTTADDIRYPPSSDKRAAQWLQQLAVASPFYHVHCEFSRMREDRSDGIIHEQWPQGRIAFDHHFGNPSTFFAGVIEYVRLATGWPFPAPWLKVKVLNIGLGPRPSGGTAMRAWPPHSREAWMIISWEDSEFLEAIMHETVHLFWPGEMNLIWPPRDEDWIEAQAVRLAEGLRV